MRNDPSCQRQRWSLPASACGSTEDNANEKIVVSLSYWKNAVK